jgi:hypothetical protein
MRSYKTPGVYVEEVSTLPPSVAEVSTAIPAFLGYAQKGPSVARVSTMLEFTKLFGDPVPTQFTVTVAETGEIKTVPDGTNGFTPDWLLYYGVSHYFKNGGGPCYVFKVGEFGTGGKAEGPKYLNALDLLKKEDEPTLIVLTDAIKLDQEEYYEVVDKALGQCEELGDRFLILDIQVNKNGTDSVKTDIDEFRKRKITNNLAYSAAYYPNLLTSLSPIFDEKEVNVSSNNINAISSGIRDGLAFTFHGPAIPEPKIKVESGKELKITFSPSQPILTIAVRDTGETARAVLETWDRLHTKPSGFTIAAA